MKPEIIVTFSATRERNQLVQGSFGITGDSAGADNGQAFFKQFFTPFAQIIELLWGTTNLF